MNQAIEIINKLENLQIEYGFKDKAGKNIIDDNPKKWDNEFSKFYYLQTPEELLKSRCGVCWDLVELERKIFTDKNIKVKTYFIYMVDNDMLPSHTFLTFDNNSKTYWFEYSWEPYRGIHEYKNVTDLLDSIKEKFVKSHPEVKKDAPLYIYEYKAPKEHIKCDEFYKFIETQKLICQK